MFVYTFQGDARLDVKELVQKHNESPAVSATLPHKTKRREQQVCVFVCVGVRLYCVSEDEGTGHV